MTKLANNLFFVHIPKTAGTAIEQSFGIGLPSLEPNNKYCWHSLFLKLKRLSGRLGFQSSYCLGDDRSDGLYGWLSLSVCAQHLTLSETFWLGLLSSKDLSSYTFFSVVRHPLDRFISSWRSHHRFVKHPDINLYLNYVLGCRPDLLGHDDLSHARRMADYLSTESLPSAISLKILRFESLDREWHKLGSNLISAGVFSGGDSWPTLAKKCVSPNKYSTVPFSATSLRRIEEFYRLDGELYGYDLSFNTLREMASSSGF